MKPKTEARILAVLPATVREIATTLGLGKSRIKDVMKTMDGKVYVGDWRKPATSGSWAAVYFDGQGHTPPRPPTITRAAWLARKRAQEEAERIDAALAKKSFQPAERMVDYAIRTQPVSVWAMGAMGARA